MTDVVVRLRNALAELASALDDGLCNSSCPDFDADRLNRALTAANQVLSETPPLGEETA